MTILVGILCKDGLVLGSDSSATFSTGDRYTIEHPCQKLRVIQKRVVVACTGAVGLGQRFEDVIEKTLEAKALVDKSPIDIGRILAARAIQDFNSTGISPKGIGALVGFSAGKRPHLCEFDTLTFQPELKVDPVWFCSMGGGQFIGDTFLSFMRDVFWPTGAVALADGLLAATWTLDHSIECNSGGIKGPVALAVLSRDAKGEFVARMLDAGDLAEHREHIAEMKELLRNQRKAQQGGAGPTPPPPPTLPGK